MNTSISSAILLGTSLISALSATVVTQVPGSPAAYGTPAAPTSLRFESEAPKNVQVIPVNSKSGAPTVDPYCGKDVTATPEPASMALLGSGLIGMTIWSRRRKKC